MKIIILILLNASLCAQSGWVRVKSPLQGNYQKIQFIGTTGYLQGYYNTNTYLHKTINWGNNWANIEQPSGFRLTSFHFIDQNTGIICGASGSRVAFYKTTNGGYNWALVYIGDSTSGGVYPFLRHINFLDVNTGYIGGNDNFSQHQIYWTSNSGDNWVSIFSSHPTIRVLKFLNREIGFILSNAATIFKTTNGGLNWVLKTSGITDFLSDQQWISMNTGFVSGNNRLILKTTNSGENWSILQFNSGYNTEISSMSFVSEHTGYYVIKFSQSNIYKTINGGLNWLVQTTPYHNSLNLVYFINPDTGFALGDTIILRTFEGGGPIGINLVSNEIPMEFNLYQNYPNPFNPVTKIKFSIPKSEPVAIKIYDALGREIVTLVNDRVIAGVYSVDWNATEYPSGIYFCRFESNKFTQTNKMILLK